MRRLLKPLEAIDAPLRSLLASDALMLLSLMVGFVAMPWWITRDGGAADITTWAIVLSGVSLVSMPLLSPLADRLDKRTLMLGGLAVYTASAAGLALMSSLGRYQLGELLLLRSVAVIALAALQPTMTSLVAELVPAQRLSWALAVQQSTQSIGRLIGPALGGVLLVVSVPAALWLHAALLLVATWLTSRLPNMPPHAAAGQAGWWHELRAGLRASWAVPLERGWTIVNFVSWMFIFPALTMLLPLKIRDLGLSGLWLGLCEAGLSVGLLIGAVGLSSWCIERFGRYATRSGAALLQGVALALAGPVTEPLVLVALFGVVGFCNSAMALVGLTHRTLARPPAFRARMMAGTLTTAYIASTLGPAWAGIALLHWNVSQIYVVFGLVGGISAMALMAVPRYREFMALELDEVEGWYERSYPQAFAPVKRTPA